MCAGFFLPLRLPSLLLLLLWGPSIYTAGAELTVVIPEKVPLDGIGLLWAKKSPLQEARRRRSVFLQPEEEEEEAAALVIRLLSGLGPNAGSDLYLDLRRNVQFLAPGFSVEEIGEDVSGHRENVDLSCFYTGHVLNRSFDSFASISACAGLGRHRRFNLGSREIGGPWEGRFVCEQNASGEHLRQRPGIPAPFVMNVGSQTERPRKSQCFKLIQLLPLLKR
uniref:Uncharacterized protein n=1 Tax=Sphaerodactylus townsendi TaxID=933632 RepID=A0ACB8E665_9SAUR